MPETHQVAPGLEVFDGFLWAADRGSSNARYISGRVSSLVRDRRIQYFDPTPGYLVQLSKLVDLEPIMNAPLNIMVDPMWGNGSGWLPKITSGGLIDIKEIHQQRNPLFPEMTRPEPIPPNVDAGLAASLKKWRISVSSMDGLRTILNARACAFRREVSTWHLRILRTPIMPIAKTPPCRGSWPWWDFNCGGNRTFHWHG